MKIALITDELSADFETAVEMAVDWGIRDFELRGYFGERVPNFSAYQKQQIRDVLDAHGARIVALSPGLFKMPYPANTAHRWSFSALDIPAYESWMESHNFVRYHLNELLPATLDYASELGVDRVVIFGFARGHLAQVDPPDDVYQTLSLAAERAAASAIDLCVETEEGYWPDTGHNTASILHKINHPALLVNWDPGNAFCAGDTPYPDGYTAIRELVRHVHFKDAERLPDGSSVYALEGQIDWQGQIDALKTSGYTGYISIETHLRPKIASAKASFDRLQALINRSSQNVNAH